jgi:hypothetical protein
MSDERNDLTKEPFPTEPTQPVPTKAELSGAVGVVSINFDEIQPNSLIVIKVNPETPQQRAMVTQQLAAALKPLRDIIRAKSLALVVMGVEESLDVLNEEQMGAMGWQRKEKSRLIVPGQF